MGVWKGLGAVRGLLAGYSEHKATLHIHWGAKCTENTKETNPKVLHIISA